jgi:hypothetical protein
VSLILIRCRDDKVRFKIHAHGDHNSCTWWSQFIAGDKNEIRQTFFNLDVKYLQKRLGEKCAGRGTKGHSHFGFILCTYVSSVLELIQRFERINWASKSAVQLQRLLAWAHKLYTTHKPCFTPIRLTTVYFEPLYQITPLLNLRSLILSFRPLFYAHFLTTVYFKPLYQITPLLNLRSLILSLMPLFYAHFFNDCLLQTSLPNYTTS